MFTSLQINYKIDKKTSVNLYLYFDLWTAHQVLEVDLYIVIKKSSKLWGFPWTPRVAATRMINTR